MDDKVLRFELNKAIESVSFEKVVTLWEEQEKELDFSKDGDKDICDAISHSYLRLGIYDKALIYLNARINSMISESGTEDRIHDNNSNWNYYCGMKGQILFEENKYFELYKLLLEYKKFGGKEESQLLQLSYIESLFYFRYFRPVLSKFLYYLSFIIPVLVIIGIIYHGNFLIPIYDYLIIGIAILILVLYLYFETILYNGLLKIKILRPLIKFHSDTVFRGETPIEKKFKSTD